MNFLPVVTSNKSLFTKIESLSSNVFTDKPVVLIPNKEDALECIRTDLPDIVFVDFSDASVEPFTFMETISDDPWLLHAGIIALISSYEETQKIEKMSGANIIVILDRYEVDDQLENVLQIIKSNSNILIQREIGADLLGTISGSFKLNNNPVEVVCYSNLISNFLYNANRIDASQKGMLSMVLNEMLLNGVEHGNCGISYDEKTEWLESGKTINELIKLKNKDVVISSKKVTLEYELLESESRFFVADEGDGFNWRELKDPTSVENIFELHGRGIMMTKKFVKDLKYNEEGNEVFFSIEHSQGDMAPEIFRKNKSLNFKKDDIVFEAGENSDVLYYIAKGTFDIVVGDAVVSQLTPSDIFVGEMSFLLGNKRSATVKATTDGKLIPISKKDFIMAVKEKPHYAIFLSRLLAERLNSLNQKIFGS